MYIREYRPIIGPDGTYITPREAISTMRALRKALDPEAEGLRRYMFVQPDPQEVLRQKENLSLIQTQLDKHLKRITRGNTRH
mgnify:CR=1 FL=1